MPYTREDFEPDAGIFDDFDGEIIDAYFGPNPNENYAAKSGKAGLGLTLVTESSTSEKPLENWYSVGNDELWQVSRDSRDIVNVKNENTHRFTAGSKAGSLVLSMAEAIGNGDKTSGQDLFVKRGFPMTSASFFIGLKFHFKSREFKTPQGNSTTLLAATKFLGEVETAGKASAKPKVEAAGQASGASWDALDVILIDMASGKSEKDLKKAAIGNADLKADPAYIKAVVNGGRIKELIDSAKLFVDADGNFV